MPLLPRTNGYHPRAGILKASFRPQEVVVTESEAMVARIEESADEIRTRFGVSRLGVFGSRIRGDESRDSDLDVLVEFAYPTFRNYMGLKRYLEELSGVAVDLVSAAALKPLLKNYVMNEVRYVA